MTDGGLWEDDTCMRIEQPRFPMNIGHRGMYRFAGEQEI